MINLERSNALVYNDLTGWYLPEQAQFVIERTLVSPVSGCIVEIGAYLGRSAVFWATNILDTDIYCIDPWSLTFQNMVGLVDSRGRPASPDVLYKGFLANIKNYPRIIPIRSAAEEVVKTWDKPIKMLHIDGDHTYEHVSMDWKLWKEKIVPGGLLFFHDYDPIDWPGVTKAADECGDSGEFNPIPNPPTCRTTDMGQVRGFVKR